MIQISRWCLRFGFFQNEIGEQVHDYLMKIQTASSHLMSLINDVLDMSRIESGKVKIEEKEVHLPEEL